MQQWVILPVSKNIHVCGHRKYKLLKILFNTSIFDAWNYARMNHKRLSGIKYNIRLKFYGESRKKYKFTKKKMM